MTAGLAGLLLAGWSAAGPAQTLQNGEDGPQTALSTRTLPASSVEQLLDLARRLDQQTGSDHGATGSEATAASTANPVSTPPAPGRAASATPADTQWGPPTSGAAMDNGLEPKGFVPEGKAVDTRQHRKARQQARREQRALLRGALANYRKQDWQAVVDALEPLRAAEQSARGIPSSELHAHQLLLAESLVRLDRPGDAVGVLGPLVERASTGWREWFWMGTAQLLNGRLEAAGAALDQALLKERTRAEIWVQRAVVEQELGRWQNARQLIKAAAAADPTHPLVLHHNALMSESVVSR